MKLIILIVMIGQMTFGSSFEEYFDSYKGKMEELPQNGYSRELLERYKPRIYVHKDSYKPMDFYNDYLVNTKMKNTENDLVVEKPSREDLIKNHRDNSYYLDLKIDNKKYLEREIEVDSKIYGRIYRDKIGGRNYLFLKYNLVFPYSGLPSSTEWIKLFISRIIGDPKAWHELDIHGAYHIVIDEKTMKPVGILLNQHNYHHSFIFDKSLKLPRDNRMEIGISKYSNEPYLWKKKKEKIRTSGSPFENLEYVHYKKDRGGLNSGMDYLGGIDEMEEVEVTLEMLPSNDPLYRSVMLLGDRKKIFGFYESWYLAGPPGMDYYTHPKMKDLGKLFSFWNIDIEDEGFFQMLGNLDKDFMKMDLEEIIEYQEKKMVESIKK